MQKNISEENANNQKIIYSQNDESKATDGSSTEESTSLQEVSKQIEKLFKLNTELKGQILEEATPLESDAKNLLVTFADKNHLSARAYHRTLRLARTIADLQNSSNILKIHIAEALSYRHTVPES